MIFWAKLAYFVLLNSSYQNYKFIMNKTSLPTIILLSVLTISCNGSITDQLNDIKQDQNAPSNELTNDELIALSCEFMGTRISQEEATLSAQAVMQFLDAQNATRSGSKRTIANVKPLTRQVARTRGAETTDTLAYVFNFSDENGYAICSADRRTSSIMALVPQGNIDFEADMSDDILHSGVMVFYGNLYATYEEQIRRADELKDSLVEAALAKIGTENGETLTRASGSQDEPRIEVYYGATVYESEVAPLIPVAWGQDNPYNRYAPLINGQHAVNGCVATATAQFLAYWRHPNTYNWDVMMPEFGNESLLTFNTISQLMSDVGVALNTKYGLKSSSAYFEDVPNYLKSLGFHIGYYGKYDKTKVENSLMNGRPVFIAGSALKYDVYKRYLIFWEKFSHTYYEENHAWLLDGILNVYTYYYTVLVNRVMSGGRLKHTLVHCNFGIPELAMDGYYSWDTFDLNEGPVTRAGHTEIHGQHNYYQYNLECIADVYK